MKAKEYYEKYKESLNSNDCFLIAEALTDIATSLHEECKKMIILRNAQTDCAKLSIVRELNQKWNAIAILCPNKLKDYMKNKFQKMAEEYYPILKLARLYYEVKTKMYFGTKQ